MNQERTLVVGYDLCDDYTQISCYNYKTGQIDSIYVAKEQESSLIPTTLAVRDDTKEWLFGEDALRCVEDDLGVLIDHMVNRSIAKEQYIIYDVAFSAEALWEKYFKKTLSLLKRYYPNDSIGQLVITVELLDKEFTQVLYKALGELGIGKDRVLIQDHTQSYLYYALSQKKEIWLNDVGLFELNEKGLWYTQITMNKKISPMVVGVEQKNFSDTFPYALLEQPQEKENLAYRFENIAKTVLHKQIISTLYITGKGFEGSWADEVIKELCIGRRVFKGHNLYSYGACYAAKERKGISALEEFIFLGEGRIKSNVSFSVYHDAKMQEAVLAKAGTPWYEAEDSFDLIPDEEEEIHIVVTDMLKKEERDYLISLDGLGERANRQTRLSVQMKCTDANTMLFTIRDMGFGELFPSTNRIWEKRISI